MNYKAEILAFFFVATGFAQFDIPTPILDQSGQNGLIQRPEFYILDWEYGTRLKEKPTSLSIEADSMGLQEVNVLVNSEERPIIYTSDVSTPVCADGDCRLMEIRLYWTLLGAYAGFDYYRNTPLTKHDHDEFLSADYLKLHQLLMDNNSILKHKKIDELVDKPKQPKTEGVDAVAGATIKEVKESVVRGALYSCYTAWHLVHGPIKDAIQRRTLLSLDDTMVLRMLGSSNTGYQLFALKRLTENEYEAHYLRIAEIFESSIPLVRTFIVKKLPDTFWSSEKLQKPFWKSFSKVDINSRSLLLDHLGEVPESVLEGLSVELKNMTKNQIKVFLAHLEESKRVSSSIQANLEAFSNSDTETNAYLVKIYMEDFQQ